MAGTHDNPVLEHLRAIRSTVDRSQRDLGDLRRRDSSVELHLATIDQHLVNLQSDVANVHLRLDRQGERLDCIERRLEIAEAPE